MPEKSRFTEEEKQALRQQNQALTNALLKPKPKSQKTETTFIAMSPNYWGKGESVEEAKKELKKAGGTLTQYIVIQLPPGTEDAFVDQLGTVRWTWAEGADKTQHTVVVAKRGTKK